MSGREAANNQQYKNYRQMSSGTMSTRRQASISKAAPDWHGGEL